VDGLRRRFLGVAHDVTNRRPYGRGRIPPLPPLASEEVGSNRDVTEPTRRKFGFPFSGTPRLSCVRRSHLGCPANDLSPAWRAGKIDVISAIGYE